MIVRLTSCTATCASVGALLAAVLLQLFPLSLPALGQASPHAFRAQLVFAPGPVETAGSFHQGQVQPLGVIDGEAMTRLTGGLQVMAASARSGSDSYETWARRVALAQGGYYVVTGLWPIIHMPSFEAVTGPKVDDWLVQTVGGLITVVGAGLIGASIDGAPSRDLAAVAVGSAVTLMAVDIIFVARGRIPPIYLLDAVAEAVLIGGWTIALTR